MVKQKQEEVTNSQNVKFCWKTKEEGATPLFLCLHLGEIIINMANFV